MTPTEKFQYMYDKMTHEFELDFTPEERSELQIIWSKYDFRTQYHKNYSSLTSREINEGITSVLSSTQINRLNELYKKVKYLEKFTNHGN